MPKKVQAAIMLMMLPVYAGIEAATLPAPESDGLALPLPVASARPVLDPVRGKTLATEGVTLPLWVVADMELLIVAFVVE